MIDEEKKRVSFHFSYNFLLPLSLLLPADTGCWLGFLLPTVVLLPLGASAAQCDNSLEGIGFLGYNNCWDSKMFYFFDPLLY